MLWALCVNEIILYFCDFGRKSGDVFPTISQTRILIGYAQAMHDQIAVAKDNDDDDDNDNNNDNNNCYYFN